MFGVRLVKGVAVLRRRRDKADWQEESSSAAAGPAAHTATRTSARNMFMATPFSRIVGSWRVGRPISPRSLWGGESAEQELVAAAQGAHILATGKDIGGIFVSPCPQLRTVARQKGRYGDAIEIARTG